MLNKIILTGNVGRAPGEKLLLFPWQPVSHGKMTLENGKPIRTGIRSLYFESRS